jgi:hypothetical protein
MGGSLPGDLQHGVAAYQAADEASLAAAAYAANLAPGTPAANMAQGNAFACSSARLNLDAALSAWLNQYGQDVAFWQSGNYRQQAQTILFALAPATIQAAQAAPVVVSEPWGRLVLNNQRGRVVATNPNNSRVRAPGVGQTAASTFAPGGTATPLIIFSLLGIAGLAAMAIVSEKFASKKQR